MTSARLLLTSARSRNVSGRRWIFAITLGAAVLTGCERPEYTLDLGDAQATLALTDATLAESIQTFLVAKLVATPSVATCADLVDLRVGEIHRLVTERQPITGAVAAFRLDRRTGYGFGKVEPPGVWSFLMLGSTKELYVGVDVAPEGTIDPREPILPQVEGTVNAIGCRQLDVEDDGRYDLNVTLFPAGLR